MYLGNYHLIGLLATGGMAELHLACARTTAGIERIVVVKQLLPEYVSKRGYVEMFLDEGRAIAALVHSNIVQLHDMAIHDGVPYLVMEYLRGHNLAKLERRLRAGGELLPMGHALAIGSAMCAGLHHAHEAKDLAGTPLQIVHRDVSPHNVMLTYDGAVKVIDFGIAKAAGRIHETRAGTLKGKLRYMAPEQVRSADIDRRADIYAVGVTLYELLTLQLPYRQRSEQMSEFSIMTAITAGNLRPARELRPEIPESLERELMRAMSLDPKERHATARELQAVLDGLARTLGLETQPADLADLLDRVMGPPNETWRALLRSDPGGEVEVIAEATRPGTSAATVATRALAPDPTSVMLFTAPASLDDSFAGAQVAESFHAAVVVDGAQVERIDIAGVRQWLTLLECLNQRSPAPRLFLARCSEPLFAQLAAVHAFAGQAQLVSFAAGYQCGQCGRTFSRVVDLERDLALLDVGHLPMVPCPRCAAVCEADDELLAIDVVRPWLGVPVPAIVREQVAILERGLATAAQPADVDSAAKARASASKLVRSSSPRLVPMPAATGPLPGAPQPAAARAPSPQPSPQPSPPPSSQPSSRRWPRWPLWAGIAAALGALALVGLWPSSEKERHAPPVGAAPAARAAELSPPVVLTVQQDGSWTGASVASAEVRADAVTRARDRYLHEVAQRLLLELPATHAPCRGGLRAPEQVARRWLDDLGGTANPERGELEEAPGPPPRVTAHFSLSAEAVQAARQYYWRSFTGWGLGFANAAPDREPGVVIIHSARPAEIPVGATLLAVNGEPVQNLRDLAEHGAATVELTLQSGQRTWRSTVPSP